MAKVVFQGNMISTDYIGFHILFFLFFFLSLFFSMEPEGFKIWWVLSLIKNWGNLLGQMNNLSESGNSVKFWWGLFPFDPVPLLRVVWRLEMKVSHMRWSMDKKTILHTVFSRILRTLQIEGGHVKAQNICIVGQKAPSTCCLLCWTGWI